MIQNSFSWMSLICGTLTRRSLPTSQTIRAASTSSIDPTRPDEAKIFRLAGTGDPYETKVRRRRHIEDPSMPNFKEVECLKWVNWRMLRDVKRRHINSQYWQYRNCTHGLVKCRTLPSVIRDVALEERNSCPREASDNYLINRCALTSRARGKLRRYRLSRIVWRDLADHGLLSGAIRAKWG